MRCSLGCNCKACDHFWGGFTPRQDQLTADCAALSTHESRVLCCDTDSSERSIARWRGDRLGARSHRREIQLFENTNKMTATDIVESVVDGLRFELADIGSRDETEDIAGLPAVERLWRRQNMSVFYHVYEENCG